MTGGDDPKRDERRRYRWGVQALPEGACTGVTGGCDGRRDRRGKNAAVTGEARGDIPGGGDRRHYRWKQGLALSEGRAQGLREGVRVDTTGGGRSSVTTGESASVTGEGEPRKPGEQGEPGEGSYTDEPVLFALIDHSVSGTRV